MKKLFATFLTVAMMASTAVPALAATALDESPANGKSDGDYTLGVGGTYVAGADAEAKISVDIKWDSMDFTYDMGKGEYSADDRTTTYPNAAWSTNKAGITVTNHSNVGIDAAMSFDATESGVVGTFYAKGDDDDYTAITADANRKVSLESAEGKRRNDGEADDESPNGTLYFGVSGSAIASDTVLGTITVKLAKADIVIANNARVVYTAKGFTDAMSLGGNIKLGCNITLADTLVYGLDENGRDISLDLNGKCLTAQLTLWSGTLTVSDSVGNGKITSSEATISILEAYVTIESGTVESTNDVAIRTEHSNAWLRIEDGKIIGKGQGLRLDGGETSVTGGSIQGYVAIEYGGSSLTVAAGEITGSEYGIFIGPSGGSVTINNGTVKGGYASVRNGDNSKHTDVYINGGTFYGALNAAHPDDCNGITVYGGIFDSNPSGIDNVRISGNVTDNGNGTWTVET